MELSINVEEVEALGQFIQLWGKNLKKNIGKNFESQLRSKGDEIGAMIIERIRSTKFGDSNYGEFMAARTKITIDPTPNGFTLSISGKKESEMDPADDRRLFRNARKEGKDWNIWAANEFGRYVSEHRGRMRIEKDVASVAAFRKSRKGFEIKGRRGAIQAIVGAMLDEIHDELQQFLHDLAAGVIDVSGDEARTKSKSQKIRGFQEFKNDLRRRHIKKSQLTELGVSEIFSGRTPSGGTFTGLRGSGGRFKSFKDI